MKIQAAVTHAPQGAFTIENLDLDSPRADEVLVKIAGVGLCHTDLLARDGVMPIPLPAVLGHEGSGTVIAVGEDVTEFSIGDRVAMSFRSCGTCGHCESHLPSYCDSMVELNYMGVREHSASSLSATEGTVSGNFFGQSSFASHALTYERNLVRVPDNVPLELTGPLGCGIQTGAGSVMNVLKCEAGSSLLILGGGAVGFGALLAAKVAGCETIIVSEPYESRRNLALELGATHALDPFAEETSESVRAILPDGVDYVLDATGHEDVIKQGLASMAALGSCVLVGTPTKPELVIDVMGFMGGGQTLHGTTIGNAEPKQFIPMMFELYEQGRFPFDRIITQYPLSEINRAIEDHHSGRCVKAVLIPD